VLCGINNSVVRFIRVFFFFKFPTAISICLKRISFQCEILRYGSILTRCRADFYRILVFVCLCGELCQVQCLIKNPSQQCFTVRPRQESRTRSDAKAVSKTQFYIQIWRRSAVDIQLGGFSACICAQIAWLNRHGDGMWQLYSVLFCVVADRELWWVRKWCGKHQQRKKTVFMQIAIQL
jgi:hypothetical protein